jgi:alpha-glucosidase (family GH31 glycosyl hydrolase)
MKNYIDKLKSQGRNLVTIIDPHIKAVDDYKVAKILVEEGK